MRGPPADLPPHRPDLRVPTPLRELRLIAVGSVGLGVALSAAGLLVVWIMGGARRGILTTTALAPFLTASGVGMRIVARKRYQLMKDLKAIHWRACTVCAHPLDDGAIRYPQCGIDITPDQAAAAWSRTA